MVLFWGASEDCTAITQVSHVVFEEVGEMET